MHPREFGRYRIVRLLPKGGMGTVYLALDSHSGQQVALKLIEQGPDPDRQEIAAAERRGAMLQEQLCRVDRRVTRIKAYGELEEFFYIEMEYVEGNDLSEVLRTGPLGVPFAARIGCDLCEVLDHSHNLVVTIESQQYRGVVHGDIKPRNIRITPSGEVRVLDFGIAKALSLTRTHTQILFGSSQYSSPERLLTGEVNIASDLWSVAVVLYEAITGRPYFEAETGPKLDTLIRAYRQLRPMPANLPPAFAAVLRKALHPNPEQRYQSADELGSDLKAYLSGQPTQAALQDTAEDDDRTRRITVPVAEDTAPDDATRRTVPAASARSPQPVRPAAPGRRSFRRFRQVAGIATLAIALVTCVFAWQQYQVWQQGSVLAHELQTEHLTDLNAAWTTYQQLNEKRSLPLILHNPRKTILDRLISSADRTILEFRNSESPTVNETDWVRAQATLAKALELDPGDKEIRAKILICEGHLARIRGTARQSAKLLNEARDKFERAHDLLKDSPDPYMGLARLYVYSLKDVDKAEDAVKAASKRGHDMGRREKAQLADGYRDRAERLLREAERATGLPEEKDYLERAQSDFRRAEDLYRDVVPFAGSTASLRRVIEFHENVDVRLKAIREGA